VSLSDGSLFVHYLGDKDQVLFQTSDEDMYWGPMQPPP
jgi:hypothetical protein